MWFLRWFSKPETFIIQKNLKVVWCLACPIKWSPLCLPIFCDCGTIMSRRIHLLKVVTCLWSGVSKKYLARSKWINEVVFKEETIYRGVSSPKGSNKIWRSIQKWAMLEAVTTREVWGEGNTVEKSNKNRCPGGGAAIRSWSRRKTWPPPGARDGAGEE